jgi:hypothetical protein
MDRDGILDGSLECEGTVDCDGILDGSLESIVDGSWDGDCEIFLPKIQT